ncbi:MAG: hypothetical protein ORN98_11545 [Alphaproteobacteria bacterium]|nr:hypothetical protein [Alphaproteobacteria bacterium]
MSRIGNKLKMLQKFLWRTTPPEQTIAKILWRQLVEAARAPIFYQEFTVPDHAAARFEMVVIHAYLLFARLKSLPPNVSHFTKPIADALFTQMTQDFEQNLRQMGVGDLRVGAKIKELMAAFYSRIVAYDRCFSENNNRAVDDLAEKLHQNIWGDEPMPDTAAKAGARHLAEYMISARAYLDSLSYDAMMGKDGAPSVATAMNMCVTHNSAEAMFPNINWPIPVS